MPRQQHIENRITKIQEDKEMMQMKSSGDFFDKICMERFEEDFRDPLKFGLFIKAKRMVIKHLNYCLEETSSICEDGTFLFSVFSRSDGFHGPCKDGKASGTSNFEEYKEVFLHPEFPSEEFEEWLSAYGWKFEENFNGNEFEICICNFCGEYQ